MAVSELPGNPVSVWTARTNVLAEFDAYIIVSFINATLVLSIGETVEEVTDSGFLGTTPTINCCQLGEDTLVQVCILKPITIMITENDRIHFCCNHVEVLNDYNYDYNFHSIIHRQNNTVTID